MTRKIVGKRISDDSKTFPSREIPRRSQDGTGRDLETLRVPGPKSPGTKQVQKSRPRDPQSPET